VADIDLGRVQRHVRVGWFEILYDLVIVAAAAQGSHLFASDQGVDLGGWLVCTFVITFILWFSTSLAVNVAPGDVDARRSARIALDATAPRGMPCPIEATAFSPGKPPRNS